MRRESRAGDGAPGPWATSPACPSDRPLASPPSPSQMHAGRQTRARRLRQRDERGPQLLPVDLEQEHRAGRRPAPLGRAARVEDPDVADALGLRQMRVPIDDRVAARETRDEPALTACRRSCDVDEADLRVLALDDALVRERLLEDRLAHVPEAG